MKKISLEGRSWIFIFFLWLFCLFCFVFFDVCLFVKTNNSSLGSPRSNRQFATPPLLVQSSNVCVPPQSSLGEGKNMAADDDGMVFEETSEFTKTEEHFLPPGWEIRTMDDGRIYYAK